MGAVLADALVKVALKAKIEHSLSHVNVIG
jgi:hypothetical protein